VQLNGTGPQVLDFEPVIWGPGPNQKQQLPLLPADTVGMAFGINDRRQAVGTTGLCSNTIIPGFAIGPHAVMWDSDGTVHDLGNLGGTSNPSVLGVGNVAFAINNRGQVVGLSATAGSTSTHPFLWTRQTGMQDLGVLDGDLLGAGLAIDNAGVVVGASVSSPGLIGGTPRAAIWLNGQGADLNTLIAGNSPFLSLLTAFAINDRGQIVGFALTESGEIHGFLATPSKDPAAALSIAPSTLPENVRPRIFGRFGSRGW
jgi:probable HAF family extracellular repeat protein